MENGKLNPKENEAASRSKSGKWTEKLFDVSPFQPILHGFRSKPWPNRIIWALAILAGVTLFAAVFQNQVHMLINEPISTSITITREKELDFPTVTICSLSLFNTTIIDDAVPYGSFELDKVFYLAQLTPPDEARCRADARSLVRSLGFDVNYGGLLRKTKYLPEALIANCVFAGQPCSHVDFEPIKTVAGICYAFNSNGSRKINGLGQQRGLRLKLTEDRNQYFSLGQDFGYRVVIHNHDEFPIPEAEGISAPLGTTTHIAMKEVVSIDNTQFSSGHECMDNTDTYDGNISIPGFTTYSPSLCLHECFITTVADSCQCIEPELYTASRSPYAGMPACQFADLCCEVREFFTFREACNCPPKCTTNGRTFTISTSTSDPGLSTPPYIGVNIYYETFLVETRETTDSYTVYSLISDTGGIAGLFLSGFTLLSLTEIVMFLIGLCSDCCGRSKKQSDNKKGNTLAVNPHPV